VLAVAPAGPWTSLHLWINPRAIGVIHALCIVYKYLIRLEVGREIEHLEPGPAGHCRQRYRGLSCRVREWYRVNPLTRLVPLVLLRLQ